MSTADWLPDGFSIQRIETNGTRLSVAVGGSGPVLVLLHGWPQTSRAWARVMPDLAQRHTVLIPDLRGTGNSDRPDGGFAKTNQADDIRGILTALNLTGPMAVSPGPPRLQAPWQSPQLPSLGKPLARWRPLGREERNFVAQGGTAGCLTVRSDSPAPTAGSPAQDPPRSRGIF
ncbi:alpha/beta fold hydrolase [Streptomyces sp. NPDC056983]|uniref:alpha/beta fold hydrolase n=1 Tax=Streptomyces sp. NPDC056983 TaxID=3345987 RepID=UPI0036268D5B